MSTLKLNSIVSQQGTGEPAISLGTDDQVTFTHAVSQPGGFNFRNKIINGNFDIWQRGTSQTSSGYGSADRWLNANIGSTKTASRQAFTLGQTEVPGEPTYFMRQVVTSVSGVGNYVLSVQRIESVRTLAGKTVTASFWAKADSNKNIAVEFEQFFGTGGSPSASITGISVNKIQITSSWAKYSLSVSIPSISGKTLGTDNNDYLQLIFWFDAGSNFNSRTNSLGQQSGTFDIAQVQLEEGAVATPFEQRPIGLELSLCQRYCYGQNNSAGQAYYWFGMSAGISSTSAFGIVQFPVTMRAKPTATFSDANTFFFDPGVTNFASRNLDQTGVNGGAMVFTSGSGMTAGYAGRFLSDNTDAAFIIWSAEL